MPRLNVISHHKLLGRSVKLTTFDFDENVVVDLMTEIHWFRDANFCGKKMLYNDAVTFIRDLNVKCFAGYNDWRLPFYKELSYLVHYASSSGWGEKDGHRINDYLNSLVFSNVLPDFYLSGSVDYNHWISGISMCIGSECYVSSEHDGYVWPVRGGKYSGHKITKIPPVSVKQRTTTKSEYQQLQSERRKLESERRRVIAEELEQLYNKPITGRPVNGHDYYLNLLRFKIYPEYNVISKYDYFQSFLPHCKGLTTWKGKDVCDGDEIWFFATDELSWKSLAGRGGIALVRNNIVIDIIYTIMS